MNNTGIVVTDVAAAKKQVEEMKSMVESIQVTNDEELAMVADSIKSVKQVLKVIKDKKDKFTAPAKAIVDAARETYDPMIKACQNAEEVLKGRAKKYMLYKEEQRRKEEERIVTRVEKGTMKPETAVRKIEAIEEVSKTVNTDNGSKLRMAKRRVAKIVHPEMIPDEYWVIDEVRVRREALVRDKSNMPQIPGVEITEEADLSSF